MINEQAEQSIIAILLMEGHIFKELTLKNEHFGHIRFKRLYEAIEQVEEKEQAIDLVTVATQLGDEVDSLGGVTYLTELASTMPSAANFKHYESLIFESYRRRKARELALKYSENPHESELNQLIDDLSEINETGIQEEERSTNDYLVEIAEEMMLPPEEAKRGFEVGFTDLDKMTGGLQPGDLIIIAARPSVGKTALALNLASGHCENGGSSHVFSLEMGTKSLLQRMISSLGNINGQKWRSMAFSERDYENAMKAIGIISNWDLNIYDQTRTVNTILSTVRKSVHENKDSNHLVVIDYLQLLQSTGRFENRNLEVGSMTRELKLLAMELEIPIVLLSQLSRGVEQRQDKRPMMSDLRDSGNIEQDADVIGFLYRDDYYNKESESQNITEIIIAKQRNGPTGTVELGFMKEYGRFVNLDYRYSEER